MAKEKKQYEVVNDFAILAHQLVQKYPEEFVPDTADVDMIRCVKITNKEPKGRNRCSIKAVTMPMLMDSPFRWYVVIFAYDWDIFTEKQKAWMVSDILHSIDKDEDGDPTIKQMEVKIHEVMGRTGKGIDFLDDDTLPNPIDELIEWKHEPVVGLCPEK